MNEREALQLADVVRVGWPNRPWATDRPDLIAQVWGAALVDVTYAEGETAVIEMMRQERPHPPSAPEILSAVFDMRERIAGTAAPDVDEMAEEVFRRVRQRGMSRGEPKRWSHPAVAAAVRAIGWRDLCYGENQSVLRAQLIRMYEAARDRIRAEQRQAPQMRAAIEAGRAAAIEARRRELPAGTVTPPE